ncbi:MAG: hypothetical protein A2V70_14105 [Planctomycetes bacterium RBG_13_63_9]|nr:MAG: hypothetical protein A2V70_14105 [Planctomycetes bacterium RBG_13_63_9]
MVVAGLGFGRQVLRWWAADGDGRGAVSQSAGVADGLGDPWRAHVLRFGDQSWSLRRQSVSGDQTAAAAALRTKCRQMVGRNRLPDDTPEPAEVKLLGRLARQQPAQQQHGQWKLYELDGPFPMVVGTRVVGARAAGDGAHRVVTWGLAMSTGTDAWTLYTFQPESPSADEPSVLGEIKIPPGCSTMLTLRVVGGGGMIAFEGPQDAEKWIRFYDGWFETHNWRAVSWREVGRWRRSGTGWHCRYRAAGEAAALVDVHLGPRRDGRQGGLIVVTPPSGSNEGDLSLGRSRLTNGPEN